MSEWKFAHSIFTHANRMDAWTYWSDMNNHMEPGVKRIELDGPFETGTTGRTIAEAFTQEWTLTDVVGGKRFVVTGYTPGDEGSLSFAWAFEDEDGGTRMTQTIRATGPDVDEHPEEFRQMEADAPQAMAQLAAKFDRLAEEEWCGE